MFPALKSLWGCHKSSETCQHFALTYLGYPALIRSQKFSRLALASVWMGDLQGITGLWQKRWAVAKHPWMSFALKPPWDCHKSAVTWWHLHQSLPDGYNSILVYIISTKQQDCRKLMLFYHMLLKLWLWLLKVVNNLTFLCQNFW